MRAQEAISSEGVAQAVVVDPLLSDGTRPGLRQIQVNPTP